MWGILCTVYEEGGVSPAGSPTEDNNDEEVLGFVYSPDEKGHTDHSRESTHTGVVEGVGVAFIRVCRSLGETPMGFWSLPMMQAGINSQ